MNELRRRKFLGLSILAIISVHALPFTARATPPRLKLVPVIENAFSSPVAITNAADGSGRLFIVDQRGKVQIVDAGGNLLPTPFLDISAKLVAERSGFDERGLLSIAFHPAYTTNGRFYVYYSAPSPNSPGTEADPVNHRSVVAEFSVSGDANIANPTSERILLTFDQPQFNHDGGQVAFGPDNFLYISTGDGGGSNDNDAGHTGGSINKPDGGLGNSQDLTKRLGKILRIDPLGTTAPGGQYSIPAANPFAAGGDGALDEIYAYGLRNPWRFSFDSVTGRLFCADVGQGDVEEINLIESGKNYGWRRFEGNFDFDATAPTTGNVFEAPIGQYAHPNSVIPGLLNIGTAVTGGYVYRGSLIPDLVGTYVFGDWTSSFSNPSGTLLALEPNGSNFDLSILDIESGNPVSFFVPAFGEDESGEIYVAGKTTLAPSAGDPFSGGPTGSIYRLTLALPLAPLPKVRLEPVVESAFPSPVAITNAGDGSDRLFVVDQRGTIHVIDSGGNLLPTPFLDVSAKLVIERPGFDERGLLSVAFHPDYTNNGKLYVYYSAPSLNEPGTEA
ncbi:MAG: glucose/arabinose dehydrogenase, partial [Verrucomicrobiales bacterium]